jgi:Phosphotransferase enzyme family
MSEFLFDCIPCERRETAHSAVATAFGAAPLTALTPITGGASGALTYRIEVARRPYLLRLETARDVFRNPHRGYACMQVAAEAGIAPPLHHADPQAGVAIMAFVPQRPLLEYPGGTAALVHDLGGLIARLQTTPTFPLLADYQVVVERMLALMRGSGLFAAGLLDRHHEGFERIRAAYPWDASAPVSSHNDPNPTNILFDGERLWLIDWEIAFRADPLVDVAITAENFAATVELETVLLQAWLGREPTRGIRARLLLMRQLTRLFYACLILSMFIGRRPQETDLTALSPDAFRDAVGHGRLTIGAAETLYQLGKMSLAGFLAGFAAPGFDEALVIARHD